jgi:hypothetical protein
VKVVATIGPNTQTLSMDDLVTTVRPSDQIDFVCDVTSGDNGDAQGVVVTQASIVALEVANAVSAVMTAPAET